MRVLIAEDDDNIRRGLCDIVRREGYEAIEARDGTEALACFDRDHPDFVCLDIMMPGLSGYDVCREMRRKGNQVPIVFISAKSEEIDKVLALELGGDDFIVKPFGVNEVIARIRAVTRRYYASLSPERQPGSFTIGDLEVFPSQLRARRGSEMVDLSLREVKILELFSKNLGVVLDRNTIFDACWGENFFAASRTLDQHIAKLRKKIESDPRNPSIIHTVHGVGYRYDG